MNDPERLAMRFAPYIKELQQLFASHGVEYGGRENIVPLARRLRGTGAIPEEMTSLLRSVIFREHEGIQRGEMIELIVVAVGGSHIDGDPEVDEAVRGIEAFVGKVLRSLRRSSFVEEPAEAQVEDEEEEAEATEAFPVEPIGVPSAKEAEAAFAAATFYVDGAPAHRPEDIPRVGVKGDRGGPSLGMYAQARAMSPEFAEAVSPGAELQVTPVMAGAPPIKPGTQLIPHVGAGARRGVAARGRWMWIWGLCALFLALLVVGLVWGRGSTKPSVDPVATVQPGPIQTTQTPVAVVGETGAGTDTSSVSGEKTAAGSVSAKGSTAGNRQNGAGGAKPLAGVPVDTTHGVSGAPPASAVVDARRPSGSPAGSSASSRSGTARSGVNGPVGGRSSTGRAAPGVPPGATAAGTAGALGGTFLVSSGVMAGNLADAPVPPGYPKMAMMAGVEGQVILQAVVSRNGSVVATHVLDGHRMLRGAAAKAVRKWHYRPYMVNGKATDVATIVIVEYKLPH